MNAKQQLKQLRADIGELQTKLNAIREAIVRVQQPDPDAVAASAQVSQKLNFLAQIRAKFARGEVDIIEVDQAAQLLTKSREEVAKFSAGDAGVAEAVALLQQDASGVSAQIRDIEAQIPELEREILRERAVKTISAYDAALRKFCEAWDEAHAAIIAADARAIPGEHLWPVLRSREVHLPHFAGGNLKFDGVNVAGLLTHTPNGNALNQRAAKILTEELA